MPNRVEAKAALDAVIKKSRVHLYKPIQIAEILYRIRVHKDINPLELEEYRTKSKKWRDDMCKPLLGRVCTSSARFQDDLFNENAIPPTVIDALARENNKTKGAVEAYIYRKFVNKYNQLNNALSYCIDATKETFDVKFLIDSFWKEPGLKRSIDKVYEIVVYALFSILVEALQLKIEVSIDENHVELLSEFSDFSKKVMCLDCSNQTLVQDGKVYRVGVTNAADRGLDMYSNWGPAIQIKHLSLDVSLAEDIVTSISSDRIVIVCKDAEKDIIVSLLTQIGWKSRIQSIVTENDLIEWYEKALRGKYSSIMADSLLKTLCHEIAFEFPAVGDMPEQLQKRRYEFIEDDFWK